ncbi:hypothetical protein WJX72_005004 [[Myrmecia] bisecta]|uniref:Tudor domain-containing protein n=1 Tax=[Myrmecia] bisecta TaxID=41462 RepID=A0AAW1Q0A1_9CHLO
MDDDSGSGSSIDICGFELGSEANMQLHQPSPDSSAHALHAAGIPPGPLAALHPSFSYTHAFRDSHTPGLPAAAKHIGPRNFAGPPTHCPAAFPRDYGGAAGPFPAGTMFHHPVYPPGPGTAAIHAAQLNAAFPAEFSCFGAAEMGLHMGELYPAGCAYPELEAEPPPPGTEEPTPLRTEEPPQPGTEEPQQSMTSDMQAEQQCPEETVFSLLHLPLVETHPERRAFSDEVTHFAMEPLALAGSAVCLVPTAAHPAASEVAISSCSGLREDAPSTTLNRSFSQSPSQQGPVTSRVVQQIQDMQVGEPAGAPQQPDQARVVQLPASTAGPAFEVPSSILQPLTAAVQAAASRADAASAQTQQQAVGEPLAAESLPEHAAEPEELAVTSALEHSGQPQATGKRNNSRKQRRDPTARRHRRKEPLGPDTACAQPYVRDLGAQQSRPSSGADEAVAAVAQSHSPIADEPWGVAQPCSDGADQTLSVAHFSDGQPQEQENLAAQPPRPSTGADEASAAVVQSHSTIADEPRGDGRRWQRGKRMIGKRIRVWWPEERQYFSGTIRGYAKSTRQHFIKYDDDDQEMIYLNDEKWHYCDPADKPQATQQAAAKTPRPARRADRPVPALLAAHVGHDLLAAGFSPEAPPRAYNDPRNSLDVPPALDVLSSPPCTEPAHAAMGSLAHGRVKRIPGGDPLKDVSTRRLIDMIRGDSTEFEADGRVLRLKQYIRADANAPTMDAIIDALAVNVRVEALYIQNFELGMHDEQLERLTEVLKLKRIWAVNVGENFQISLTAWERFCQVLPQTAVGYMYVSEHHLLRTDLKERMIVAIRQNRKIAPARHPDVIVRIGNMWWNPKLPTECAKAAAEAAAVAAAGGQQGGLVSAFQARASARKSLRKVAGNSRYNPDEWENDLKFNSPRKFGASHASPKPAAKRLTKRQRFMVDDSKRILPAALDQTEHALGALRPAEGRQSGGAAPGTAAPPAGAPPAGAGAGPPTDLLSIPPLRANGSAPATSSAMAGGGDRPAKRKSGSSGKGVTKAAKQSSAKPHGAKPPSATRDAKFVDLVEAGIFPTGRAEVHVGSKQAATAYTVDVASDGSVTCDGVGLKPTLKPWSARGPAVR